MDYLEARDGYLPHWENMLRDFQQPYFPNVSVGWDPALRTRQDEPWVQARYPFTGVITGNSPAEFQKALALVKTRLLDVPTQPKVITINCWNEWTEGSYLEPDTQHGMKYLEAVRSVFGGTELALPSQVGLARRQRGRAKPQRGIHAAGRLLLAAFRR